MRFCIPMGFHFQAVLGTNRAYIRTQMAIDVQVIFYLIDKLNADKSPGADGIHQRGLEELKGEIGGLWAKTCKCSLQRDVMVQ